MHVPHWSESNLRTTEWCYQLLLIPRLMLCGRLVDRLLKFILRLDFC